MIETPAARLRLPMEVVTTALLTPLYWCGLPELHRPGLRSLRRYPHWLPHVMVGAPFDALAIRSAIVVPRGPFLSTARLSTDRATLRPKEVASSGAEDAYRACCPWCRGRESNPQKPVSKTGMSANSITPANTTCILYYICIKKSRIILNFKKFYKS